MKSARMKRFLFAVLLVVGLHFSESRPTPSGTNRNSDGLVGQRVCTDGHYESSNLCCLNCPAGQRKSSPCTSDGGPSVCPACAAGTFTEHGNSLPSCLTCTKCRPDQEEVRPCSLTQDTVCRCSAGLFCSRDQPCEVCHRCRSCKDGETTVKNCTADSNRECAKSSTTGPPSMAVWLILPGVLIAVAVGFCWVYKRKRHLLTCPPCPSRDNSQENDDDSLLVPLKGEESLKSCFEYFYELDIKFHKRFFRSLSVSDNAITNAFRQDPQDAVYDLLVKWLEKQGREASLKHLLRKLRDLDQNFTADEIVEKAISNGHYVRGVDSTSNSLAQQ
ncbi:unnamed protein product [Lota lota]